MLCVCVRVGVAERGPALPRYILVKALWRGGPEEGATTWRLTDVIALQSLLPKLPNAIKSKMLGRDRETPASNLAALAKQHKTEREDDCQPAVLTAPFLITSSVHCCSHKTDRRLYVSSNESGQRR